MTTTSELAPVWRAGHQQAMYRALITAMAYPGSIHDLGRHLGDERALTGVLATCLDQAVSLADASGLCGLARLRFLAAGAAPASAADWIAVDGRQAPTIEPRCGSVVEPEASATLVIDIDRIGAGGRTYVLTGPGIAEHRRLDLAGLDPAWLTARARWCTPFPLGVDMILADNQRIAALPRTTTIQEVR